MAVVTIDKRGRITLPKRYAPRGGRAVIIPAGKYLIVIPIPDKPEKFAEGWLPSNLEAGETKRRAEEAARRDAVARAKRRRQL